MDKHLVQRTDMGGNVTQRALIRILSGVPFPLWHNASDINTKDGRRVEVEGLNDGSFTLKVRVLLPMSCFADRCLGTICYDHLSVLSRVVFNSQASGPRSG